jgi:hypothetical protein
MPLLTAFSTILLFENLPCPVLQYTDDTTINFRSSEYDMCNLKVVLDSSSVATVLQINYHKSTFAPIHVDLDFSNLLASILGCHVATFPHTYLGHLSSPINWSLTSFAPTKLNRKCIQGWIGKMLPISSQAIFVKASLHSMASHLLSTMSVPLGTLHDFDKSCRAFL